MTKIKKKIESGLVLRIRALCKEKGISMRRLERDNEFGNGLISKWSNSSPSVNHLQKVARYFDVTINYLLGEVDDRYKIPRKLVMDLHGEYSVDGQPGSPIHIHDSVNIDHTLDYLMKFVADESKAILYKDRVLTLQEVKDLKEILKDVIQECEIFDVE